MLNKIMKIGGAVLLLLLFLSVFGYACPFQRITGFPCPGCNMMTSAYWLFVRHNFEMSLYYHALLLFTIFAFILCVILQMTLKGKYINKILVGWGLVMIGYYVLRMLLYFPEAPMIYDTSSVFYQWIHTFM